MAPAKKGLKNIKNKFLRRFAKDKENTANKIQTSDDPIAELGAGIITFHKFLTSLILLFLILIVLHIPVFINFIEGGFFKSDDILLTSTLGNLGFSQTTCVQSSMIKGNDQ